MLSDLDRFDFRCRLALALELGNVGRWADGYSCLLDALNEAREDALWGGSLHVVVLYGRAINEYIRLFGVREAAPIAPYRERILHYH